MKYGYCVNMLATDLHKLGYDKIPLISEAGFDYVELPIAQIMELDDASFQAMVLDTLKRASIPCLRCNNMFSTGYRLTGPNANHPAALVYAKAALDRMARMDVRQVVFGSSGARNYPAGFPKEKAMEQLHQLLPLLGDLARKRNIELVIEPLNRGESNLINSVTEALALAQAVAHSHVKVLADSYHMSLEKEPFEDILNVGGMLGHVHLARLLGRSLPDRDDSADHQALYKALNEIGYDGCVSIEAYAPQDCDTERFAAALQYLKELETGLCRISRKVQKKEE